LRRILVWGRCVSAGFMLIEAAGLLVVATAWSATAIAGACLTGFGFALVFLAGINGGGPVGAQSRGTAIGVYALFLDVSLSVRPAAGWAARSGFSAPFYLSALAAVAAGRCMGPAP
jgi:hypothetical protein